MIAGVGDGLSCSYLRASFLLMLLATLPRRCHDAIRLMTEGSGQLTMLPLHFLWRQQLFLVAGGTRRDLRSSGTIQTLFPKMVFDLFPA